MAEPNLLTDAPNEQNLLVLQTYADRATAAKSHDQEHSGWLDRLAPSSDLDDDLLTRIHGELIATGMLKFQLTNRSTGLQYRVSDSGRQALTRPIAGSTAPDEASDEFPALQDAA